MIGKRHTIVSSFALLVITIIAEVANAGPPRKIVGGEDASPGEFPYLVSLRKNGHHFCGGAIIGSRHVLTAAHCVYKIRLSSYSAIKVVTGTISSSWGGQTYNVSKIFVHKGFNDSIEISSHDIALIELKSDITFNTYTSTIELPKAVTPGGASAIISGWGYRSAYSELISPFLQKASMTTVAPVKCESLMEYGEIYTEQICALNVKGIGICNGDSGGPIVVGNEVIGVASYSVPCAVGYPDVYTAVYYFIDWIKENIK